ncbi:MAG: esterase-like activity of phytase family protein [Albidovulum sp.]|uniref:esterase-like activity of phytase family protein n=1 Tax=Albidovulum sp. TaxID=1872424 RepID=UPI003C95198E
MTRTGLSCLWAIIFLIGNAPKAPAAELVSRGGYSWAESYEGFGGFSGLAMAPDGASLLAVSDGGWLVRARLSRDADGRLRGVTTEWRDRFRDNQGDPVNDFKSDAEALAVTADGTAYVAFEGYTRIAAFHPPDMMPRPLHRWDRFKKHWGNEAFEGLIMLPDGRLMAVLEEAHDGRYRTILGRDHDWQAGPSIPAPDGYAATDSTIGPDGRFYLLERRVTLTARFATRIRRFTLDDGGFGPGETLLETAQGALGNMEGISLWPDKDGRTVVTLIADDNFLPFQKTLLVEYDLAD